MISGNISLAAEATPHDKEPIASSTYKRVCECMDECTASCRRVGVNPAHLFANWPCILYSGSF